MNRKSNYYNGLAVLIFVCANLVGCATTTQPLSDADRKKYSSVRINPTVEMPAAPYLLAPGTSIGLMFGAIGGLAMSGAYESDQQLFARYLDKNGISIESISREELEAAIRASNKFQIARPEDKATPEITVTVQLYGFSVPHLVSSNVVPVVMLKCDMKDDTGKVIWSAGDRLLPSIASPIESTSWETILQTPSLATQRFREAVKIIATKIAGEL